MSRSKVKRKKQRDLDLGGISDDECDTILKVIQRDMDVRESEKSRLSSKQQEVYKADQAAQTLQKLALFTANHCMRCFGEFYVLLNPKYVCFACNYNVCKRCCAMNKKINDYLCNVCDKEKDIMLQRCDWFYDAAKKRFKYFGSTKFMHALSKRSGMNMNTQHSSVLSDNGSVSGQSLEH